MTTFTILASGVESVTEEKNSDFLTFLHPVSSREEAMDYVEQYRKKYPDANHVCWAYVIGNTRQPQTQAFNDDGEPSGTAGKPMLYVLTEREVGNALAIVVRYFGGVKLGAGGLVRAYSAAVSRAVGQAQLLTISPNTRLKITVSFAQETKIRHLIDQHKGRIIAVEYSAAATFDVNLPATQADAFTQQAMNETCGNANICLD